jgi:PAS domain S-box-containing protein
VAAKHDENELLQSVPLHIGNSIMAARQRSEQRREAYWAEAQRLSHSGSFGWRPSTGEIIWSEETFRIFQYDRTTTPTLKLVLQRVHPEDAALVQQTLERVAQDGKDYDHEYRLLMPGGSVKHVHVVARALSDESGGVEFVGAVMDVTESKRVEKQLRRSEESLLEAQRLSHTGSWRHDLSSGAVTVSPEIYRMHDINPDEDASNTEFFFSRFHPEDRKRVVDVFERAEREKTEFQVDYRIVLSDGTIKHLHTIGRPILNESGDLVEFVGTAIDVTAAKRAEETLRRSEAYLAEAQRLTHTGSGAWRVPERDALYLSEEWYRIYGFAPEEGLSAWEKRLQRMHPDDQAPWREITDRAIREKSDYEGEHRILLPDGTVKYTHTVGHPVLNASGNVEQFVCTMMDVTERKQAEEAREALRQVQADLARVSRVTTMGELTASLAHEVNQPIAAASTNANTCLRWLAGDTPNIEEARSAAMRIVKDVKRAGEIISRIRQLFQKGTSQRELVDLNEIIREMIVLLRGETTRRDILVGTDLATDLPRVKADRVQLQQVLMNLMINSIEAMRDVDGPRELSIKSQSAEDARLMVSVTDTGVGLPPQQADQIFIPFFTTKCDGTGMGLRISRSIIESHGGRLWAADNPPRGARFCFTLWARGGEYQE